LFLNEDNPVLYEYINVSSGECTFMLVKLFKLNKLAYVISTLMFDNYLYMS